MLNCMHLVACLLYADALRRDFTICSMFYNTCLFQRLMHAII